MHIFRIEDPSNGKGPWINDHMYTIDEEDTPDYSDRENYPGMFYEFDYINSKINRYQNKILSFHNYVCGVDSMSMLLHWFPEKTLRKLNERNVRIFIYKIFKYNVLFGRKQIFFLKEKAKFVKDIPPNNYYDLATYEVE